MFEHFLSLRTLASQIASHAMCSPGTKELLVTSEVGSE